MRWLFAVFTWTWNLLSWRHDQRERTIGAQNQQNADLQASLSSAQAAQRRANEVERLPDSELNRRLERLRNPGADQ